MKTLPALCGITALAAALVLAPAASARPSTGVAHTSAHATLSTTTTTPPSDRMVRDAWVGGVRLGWYHDQILAVYPKAIAINHGSGCMEYARYYTPTLGFHAFLGPLSLGRVYGITAPDYAMTDRNVGWGSQYWQVKHAYADRPSFVNGHWFYVYAAVHDYLGFHVVVHSSTDKRIDAVRIGWKFFASGGPLCGPTA